MNTSSMLIQMHSIVPLLLVFLFAGVSDAQCPDYVNSKIERCVLPVVEYAKVLNAPENTTSSPNQHHQRSKSQFGQALSFPKIGGQVFQELCRLIRAFDVCVQSYKQVCPKHITINLIDASYGYLCNEGYQTFMASAECLMGLDQKPAVKHCHDQTLTDIENANSEATLRMDSKLTRMCGALNYFAACVRQHIWNGCGVDAWHVIFRVLKDTTKTLMPSCVFSGESAKLDAEQRQQQAEEESLEEFNSPYSNRINNHAAKGRSTSSTKLTVQSVYSNEDKDQNQFISHSLETQQEDDDVTLEQTDSNTGQFIDNRQPISFEIHDESMENRLPTDRPMTARFGTWSSKASRSHSTLSIFAFLFMRCILNRIFV